MNVGVKLALWLPGVAFVLLELILEPVAVRQAVPGLLFWGVLYYGGLSLALRLRRQKARLPRFRVLVGLALLLVALDQTAKLLVQHALPVGAELTLVPRALTLTHVHNVSNSWLVAQFGLTFIGDAILIAVAAAGSGLTLSLYRYYTHRCGRGRLWAGIAMVTFFAGLSSALIEIVARGYTVDYLGFAGLVVADLKDFYLNIGIAAFFAEMAEQWPAARHISTRQALAHLGAALALSVAELRAWRGAGASGHSHEDDVG
jgi:lipoprotein signal peptidase